MIALLQRVASARVEVGGRVTGAIGPGLLMLVPGVGVIVGIPWSLVAMVIAVRQALDFTTRRALGTVLVGALVMAVVVLLGGRPEDVGPAESGRSLHGWLTVGLRGAFGPRRR